MTVARREFDPELKAGLAVVGGVFPPTITPDLISFMRRSYASPPIEDTLGDRAIERSEHTIAGHRGDAIGVSVLRPTGVEGPRHTRRHRSPRRRLPGRRHGARLGP